MRFKRKRGGSVEADVSEVEAAVLASAVGDLLLLLGEGEEPDADPLAALVGMTTGDVRTPEDPALARLLPDAYRDDAAEGLDARAAASEFRRFTEADLREGKRAHCRTVLASLEPVAAGGRLRLDRDACDAWLGCLNDLRLVLGTRLEVTEDLVDVPDDDPRAPALQVYGWLGWLQESLLECLSPRGH